MICWYEYNQNGSITIGGYLKRVYYGYTLQEAKRRYRQEAKKTGYPHRIQFIKL